MKKELFDELLESVREGGSILRGKRESCAAEAARPSSESAGKDDLEVRARAGIPLSRSVELIALAHKVGSRRQLQEVEFSDSWVEKLAGDLVQFND